MKNLKVWECQSCRMLYRANPHYGKGKTTTVCRCGSRDVWVFDSDHEHQRWHSLKQLEKAGQIRGLRRQVKLPLIVNGMRLQTPKGRQMVYVADATGEEWTDDTSWTNSNPFIDEPNWRPFVEDSKGRRSGAAYDLFWLKREILRANGIEVREI